MQTPTGDVVLDMFSRPLRDLRLSVTDRCNLRCTYCMPRKVFGPDHLFLPKELILSYEEITRLVAAISRLGLKKIRLTGGEPLLRRDLPRFISMLKTRIPDDIELAMTTNGILLSGYASHLAEAGLDRVTVSLDSLDDEIFRSMSDSDISVNKVLEGITAAKEAGLGVKVNCVVQKRVNEEQIIPLVEYFRDSDVILRFIEYMDVGNSNGWSMEEMVPASDIIDMISLKYPIEAVKSTESGQVAKRWRYLDGAGEIGFITSVSEPFCGDCCRARLSVDGHLYTCLFSANGNDLMTPLREGLDEMGLSKLVADIWNGRDDRYSELRNNETRLQPKVEMSYIGG